MCLVPLSSFEPQVVHSQSVNRRPHIDAGEARGKENARRTLVICELVLQRCGCRKSREWEHSRRYFWLLPTYMCYGWRHGYWRQADDVDDVVFIPI